MPDVSDWHPTVLGSRGAIVGALPRTMAPASALRSWEPERASAELAHHVLDVMLATEEAGRTGRPVDVSNRVEPARLLPDGWIITDPDGGPDGRAK